MDQTVGKRMVQNRRLEEVRDQLEEEKLGLKIAKVEIDRGKLALEKEEYEKTSQDLTENRKSYKRKHKKNERRKKMHGKEQNWICFHGWETGRGKD